MLSRSDAWLRWVVRCACAMALVGSTGCAAGDTNKAASPGDAGPALVFNQVFSCMAAPISNLLPSGSVYREAGKQVDGQLDPESEFNTESCFGSAANAQDDGFAFGETGDRLEIGLVFPTTVETGPDGKINDEYGALNTKEFAKEFAGLNSDGKPNWAFEFCSDWTRSDVAAADGWTDAATCSEPGILEGTVEVASLFQIASTAKGAPIGLYCTVADEDGRNLLNRIDTVVALCGEVRSSLSQVLEKPVGDSRKQPGGDGACENLGVDARAASLVKAMNNRDQSLVAGCSTDALRLRIEEGPLPAELEPPAPCEDTGAGIFACETQTADGMPVEILVTSGSAGEGLYGWRPLRTSTDGSAEELAFP